MKTLLSLLIVTLCLPTFAANEGLPAISTVKKQIEDLPQPEGMSVDLTDATHIYGDVGADGVLDIVVLYTVVQNKYYEQNMSVFKQTLDGFQLVGSPQPISSHGTGTYGVLFGVNQAGLIQVNIYDSFDNEMTKILEKRMYTSSQRKQ